MKVGVYLPTRDERLNYASTSKIASTSTVAFKGSALVPTSDSKD